MDLSFRYDMDAPLGAYVIDMECPQRFTGPDKLIWSLPDPTDGECPNKAARWHFNGILNTAAFRYFEQQRSAKPAQAVKLFLKRAKEAQIAAEHLSHFRIDDFRLQQRGLPFGFTPFSPDIVDARGARQGEIDAMMLVDQIIETSGKLHSLLEQFGRDIAIAPKQGSKAKKNEDHDLLIRCLLIVGAYSRVPYWAYERCPLVKGIVALYADAGWKEPADLQGKVWISLSNNILKKLGVPPRS